MHVILADALGVCFGVRDALNIAGALPHPEQVTIHGDLVHNEAVLVQLQLRGFHTTGKHDRNQLPHTSAVLVTAHGISEVERQRLLSAGRQLIDTTCPLVRRVHQAAQKLAAEGRHVIVIGRRDTWRFAESWKTCHGTTSCLKWAMCATTIIRAWE